GPAIFDKAPCQAEIRTFCARQTSQHSYKANQAGAISLAGRVTDISSEPLRSRLVRSSGSLKPGEMPRGEALAALSQAGIGLPKTALTTKRSGQVPVGLKQAGGSP